MLLRNACFALLSRFLYLPLPLDVCVFALSFPFLLAPKRKWFFHIVAATHPIHYWRSLLVQQAPRGARVLGMEGVSLGGLNAGVDALHLRRHVDEVGVNVGKRSLK